MTQKFQKLFKPIVFILIFLQFCLIVRFGVDLPVQDETDMLNPDSPAYFSGTATPSWFFVPHGQHIIVPSRVFTWIMIRFADWNVRTVLFLNYIFLCLAIYFLCRLVREKKWILFSFLPFFFSDKNFENTLFGFQNVIHFFILFLVLTLFWLTQDSLNRWRVLSGIFSGVLCLLAFGSGPISILALGLSLALWGYLEKQKLRLYAGSSLVAASGVWFLAYYRGLPNMTTTTSPFSASFWDFFLNLVSNSLGFETVDWRIGALGFLLLLSPFFFSAAAKKDIHLKIAGIGFISILAGMAAIALGRAGLGVEASKPSRYFEIGYFLIPFSAMALQSVRSSRVRASIGISLWAMCWIGFSDNWNYIKTYRDFSHVAQDGRECARIYFEGPPRPFFCDTVFNADDTSRQLESMKRLNLSVYQSIMAEIESYKYWQNRPHK